MTGVFSDTEDQAPVALGDAAQALMGSMVDGDTAVQESLDGTDYTKAKFVGMSFNSLDRDIKIGDELTFLVHARCVGTSEEARKGDATLIQHLVKMDVQSVVIHEG